MLAKTSLIFHFSQRSHSVETGAYQITGVPASTSAIIPGSGRSGTIIMQNASSMCEKTDIHCTCINSGVK